MSEEEKDAGVSQVDAPVELTNAQAWAEVNGQDEAPATAMDSEDNKPEAATDEKAEEHAEEARSEDDDGVDGQQPTKQQSEIDTEVKRLRGQVGGKDRRIRELEQKIADQARERKEKSKDAGRDPKDLDELEAEYPDIVKPLRGETADLRARIDALTQSVDTVSELHQTTLESDYEQEFDTFTAARPSGFGVVKDNRDAFWEWVDDQPKRDRDLAYSSQERVTDGKGMAGLLNRFEQHLGVDAAPVEPASQEAEISRGKRSSSDARLQGAKTVSGGAQKATSKPQKSETDRVAIWNSLQD